MAGSKVRVAILGGGIGALSAAFALTEVDPDKFDITVHQLGWRLGGKTASGRNGDCGQRIEEHGLHIWAGFYENAFTILRVALKALNRPSGHPIATIADAFKRQDQIFYSEHVSDTWSPWPFWFEPDQDETLFPGRDRLMSPPDDILPSLSTIIIRMIDMITRSLQLHRNAWPGDQKLEAANALASMAPERRERFKKLAVSDARGHPLLVRASIVSEDLKSADESVRVDAEADMIELLNAFLEVATAQYSGQLPDPLRRALVLAITGTCVLLGLLKNHCLRDGLEVLDKYEFMEFLDNSIAANSAIVVSLYEYVFGFEEGKRSKPRLSACSAVEGLLRLFFTYKGAFFFKSVVGMGDTICTPLYQLLRQRGVKFEFFHKVKGLAPSADGSRIETVLIDKQVTLADGLQEYQPLIPVNGADCWPSAPLWKQIKDGEALAAAGYDFENAYGPPFPPQPPPVKLPPLRLGQDFDEVILGISVGALSDICQPLMLQKPAWTDMINNLPTVRTQALQLWLKSGLDGLGGPYVKPPVPPTPTGSPPMGPIVTTCNPPFDTYSDMSQLLNAEAWTAPPPGSIAYFCAILEDGPNDAAQTKETVKKNARGWMTSWLHTLWPNIGESEQGFRWNLIYSKRDLTGPARLDDQYWRANINPSDRYVLSLPGTLRHRMEPGNTGYTNLYVAGDWTRVPEINAGCVEVAAMSGLAAASALSGVNIPIVTITPEPFKTNRYINYGGWNTLPPPPYDCNDSTFYSFAFPADKVACQDFIDRSYNVAAGRNQFRVMLDMAFLNIVQSRKTAASAPPFSLEGTMSETDIGLWLAVGSYERGAVIPKSIGFVPAYLFINNGWSAVAGHDVWGYPKYFATMTLPETAPSSGPFEVSALGIPKFAPTAHAEQHQMLNLNGTDVKWVPLDQLSGGPLGAPVSPTDIFKQLCVCADEKLLKELADSPDMPTFLGTVGGVPFPVFYLKQVRSADSATAASYQAVLRGDLSLTKLYEGGLTFGNWSLELGEFDSLPFVRDLGLGTPKDGKVVLTTTIGAWAQIDFTVGMASPIT